MLFFLFFFFLKLYYLQYEKILANTTLTLTQTPLCFYPSPLRAAPTRSRINIYWLRFVSGFWFFKIFDLLEFHPFHNLDVKYYFLIKRLYSGVSDHPPISASFWIIYRVFSVFFKYFLFVFFSFAFDLEFLSSAVFMYFIVVVVVVVIVAMKKYNNIYLWIRRYWMSECCVVRSLSLYLFLLEERERA